MSSGCGGVALRQNRRSKPKHLSVQVDERMSGRRLFHLDDHESHFVFICIEVRRKTLQVVRTHRKQQHTISISLGSPRIVTNNRTNTAPALSFLSTSLSLSLHFSFFSFPSFRLIFSFVPLMQVISPNHGPIPSLLHD